MHTTNHPFFGGGDLIIAHQTICTIRNPANTPRVPAEPHGEPSRALETNAPTNTESTPAIRTSRVWTTLRERRRGSLNISTHCEDVSQRCLICCSAG